MYKAVVAYTVKTWSFTKRDSQNTLNSSRSQFLKVSQNLQKNTNTGVSQDPLPEFLLKKRPRHRCFSVKFLKHLFYTTPPGGYFWFVTSLPINWGNKSDWMYFLGQLWKSPSRITSQNLGQFQDKCLWWSSVIA